MLRRVTAALTGALTAALLIAGSVVHGGVAWATPAARLVYVRDKGAESCPDEGRLRAIVRERLGYDPFRAFASATLFAEVSRDARGYRARIKLVGDDNTVRGSRELEDPGPDCTDLVETIVTSPRRSSRG